MVIIAIYTVGYSASNEREFLAAGDSLSEPLEPLKKLHRDWAIPDNLFNRPIAETTFNSLLTAAFTEDNYKKADEIFSSPYSIPVIFYLPYLGPFIITTNVEGSFDSVVGRLKLDWWHNNIITPQDDVADWDSNRYSVFYIHGHLKRPNSLVMTAKQYEEMYPEYVAAYDVPHGAGALLSNTVCKYSILFLGASLQTDKTVQVINNVTMKDNVLAQRRERDLHLITVAEADEYGRLVNADALASRDPIRFSERQYSEISSILLQLIRETKKDWPHCKWYDDLPPSGEEVPELSSTIQERIAASLDRSDAYEQILIDDGTVCEQNLIRYLYAHHSVAQHDKGKGWSICCISESEFSLGGPYETAFPLHNYPIGDTIYVLSSHRKKYGHYSLCYDAAYKEIVPSIRTWRTHDCPFYPGMERDGDPPDLQPRVRIIALPLPPSLKVIGEILNSPDFIEVVGRIDDILKEIALGQGLSASSLTYLRKMFSEIAREETAIVNTEKNTDLLDPTPVKKLKKVGGSNE